MKTAIWIIVNSDNRNLVYPAVVAEVKKVIRLYLGNRNCEADDPETPVVIVTCDVNQDDLNAIKRIFDNDSIWLTALIGSAESDRVNGDVINLL